MSPGQLAWCAHHFDLCPKVFDAAAAARTASTDIIKDDDPDRVAKRNAVRHALWVALMISAYGISERDALLITTAHEMDDRRKEGSWGSPDNKIDLHNNFIGGQVGRAVQRQKESDPSVSAYNQAVDFVYILVLNSTNCPVCLNLKGGTYG